MYNSKPILFAFLATLRLALLFQGNEHLQAQVDPGNDRYCQKSFPWPERSGKRPFEDYDPVEELSVKEMKKIRDNVLVTLDETKDGSKAVQGKLMAEFYYLQVLEREGKYGSILKAISQIKRRPYWTNSYLRVYSAEAFEENTYLSVATLQKFIRLLEMRAQQRINNINSSSILRSFLEYHDNQKAFAVVEDLVGKKIYDPGESTDALVEIANSLEELPNWERKLEFAKYPNVIGLDVSSDYIDIYTKRDRLGLIRIDPNSNSADYYGSRDAWNEFNSTCIQRLREFSSNDYTIANIRRDGKRYLVQLSDGEVKLSAKEAQAILKGRVLADNHPLTELMASNKPIVIWSNPMMTKPGYELNNAEAFAFGLQKAYPNAKIFRDDFDPSQTPLKAAELASAQLNGPDDLYVVVDNESGVNDGNIINNIREDLESNGVHIVEFKRGEKWSFGKGKGVIIVTGHIDRNMAKYLRALGESGYFDGNFVLLNTCRTNASTQLIEEINSKFGAIATHRFKGTIHASDVGDFIMEIINGLSVDPSMPFNSTVVNAAHKSELRGLWILCHYLSSTKDGHPYEG